MENKTMTKKDMYALIAEMCADNPDVVAFCENEVAKLDAKAAKAKERAAQKRKEGDELYAAVVSVLTAEPQTRDAVFAQIEGEGLTVAKIGARLSQAVKNGDAVKTTEKVEGKSKVMYALAE